MQAEQALAPVEVINFPAEHAVQDEAPGVGEKDPEGQAQQSVLEDQIDPTGPYCPGEQLIPVHDEAPVRP